MLKLEGIEFIILKTEYSQIFTYKEKIWKDQIKKYILSFLWKDNFISLNLSVIGVPFLTCMCSNQNINSTAVYQINW
jgi:hypothetical protein